MSCSVIFESPPDETLAFKRLLIGVKFVVVLFSVLFSEFSSFSTSVFSFAKLSMLDMYPLEHNEWLLLDSSSSLKIEKIWL